MNTPLLNETGLWPQLCVNATIQVIMPQAVTTTPHRNDPCPCGSGKKYKNCCRLNAVPSSLPQAEISRLSALLNSGQYPEAESRARQLLERFPMAGVLWK